MESEYERLLNVRGVLVLVTNDVGIAAGHGPGHDGRSRQQPGDSDGHLMVPVAGIPSPYGWITRKFKGSVIGCCNLGDEAVNRPDFKRTSRKGGPGGEHVGGRMGVSEHEHAAVVRSFPQGLRTGRALKGLARARWCLYNDQAVLRRESLGNFRLSLQELG